MTDTNQNIKLPRGTAVDLYAASGIAVGTQINIENLTQYPIKFHSGDTLPIDWEQDDESGYFSRVMAYKEITNNSGDSGAWALSETQDGLVQVTINQTEVFDYDIEVAKGNVPGVTGVAVVMRNPHCSNTEFTDVWGGGGATYDNFIPPSSAVALEIRSDNPADTLTTGAGAWTALITTLDGDYNPQTPMVVNLDGTNWVSIPGTHFRPHHLTATSGAFITNADQTTSHQSNAGTITIREVVSNNIWMTIQPEFGKSEDSNVTVPAGFTLFIKKLIATWSQNQSGDIFSSVKPFGTDTARISSGKLSASSTAPLVLDLQTIFRSSEKTDRVFRAKSTNADVELTIIQEYELIENSTI